MRVKVTSRLSSCRPVRACTCVLQKRVLVLLRHVLTTKDTYNMALWSENVITR